MADWNDAIDYTQDVSDMREQLRQMEVLEQRYDRGGIPEEMRNILLWNLSTQPPAMRANLYAMYAQMALVDPEVMTDAEIFILSFAYQDHKASQAVEAGEVQAVEQGVSDELRVPYDRDWYADAVSHHGNYGEAKEYLVRLFGVEKADSEYSQLPDQTIGEQIAKWLSVDPTGGSSMHPQPSGPLWNTIQQGLNFQRDEVPLFSADPNQSIYKLSTEGDRWWNNFWRFVDVVAVVGGVAAAGAMAAPLGIRATAGAVGPIRNTRNLYQATGRAWQQHVMGGQQQLKLTGQADISGTQNWTNLAYVANRTMNSPETVLGRSATASQRVSRMAGKWFMSPFRTSSVAAATFVMGNVALNTWMTYQNPEGVRSAEDDVRQEEFNTQWDEIYTTSVEAGLSPEQAERRANLDVPDGQSPQERGEVSDIEIIGGVTGNNFQGAPIAVRRDILALALANVNQTALTANVRVGILADAGATRSAAWEQTKQESMDAGLTESQAENEANLAYPPLDDDEVTAVLEGNLSAAEASLSPDKVTAITEFFNKYGLRYFDPATENAYDIQNDGMRLYLDPSDPLKERYIVVPGGGLEPAALAEMTAVLGKAPDPDEDPLIRVDEDYMATTYRPVQERRVWNPNLQNETWTRDPRDNERERSLVRGGWEDRGPLSPQRAEQLAADRGAVLGSVSADDEGWEKRNKMRVLGLPPIYEVDAQVKPQYYESSVLDFIADLSPVQTFRFQNLAARAGFYEGNRPTMPGHISEQDQNIVHLLMGQGNVDGKDPWQILTSVAESAPKTPYEESAPKAPRAARDPFAVPAHLRKIPGEKTIAEETKLRFRQKMGRDPRPDELKRIANELSGYYTTSNQEEIALYLAAYNGDNQGLLTGAQMQRIEEPGAAASYDIAERWANEIDLNGRREENSETFQRMLAATLGNRPSVGNLTAARNVTQIGRT